LPVCQSSPDGPELVILGAQAADSAAKGAEGIQALWPNCKIIFLFDDASPADFQNMLTSQIDGGTPLSVSPDTLIGTLDLIVSRNVRIMVMGDKKPASKSCARSGFATAPAAIWTLENGYSGEERNTAALKANGVAEQTNIVPSPLPTARELPRRTPISRSWRPGDQGEGRVSRALLISSSAAHWRSRYEVVKCATPPWTADNLLRQVSHQGQREDKPARQMERLSRIRKSLPEGFPGSSVPRAASPRPNRHAALRRLKCGITRCLATAMGQDHLRRQNGGGIKCPNDAPNGTNKSTPVNSARAKVACFALALSRNVPNICPTPTPLLIWPNVPTITSSLFG